MRCYDSQGQSGIARATGGPLMLEVTTPLLALLAPFAGCFNEPVHDTFCVMVVAWAACLGRRTISRVWQTTGRAEKEDHSKAYRLFNQAVWNWDCLAQVF